MSLKQKIDVVEFANKHPCVGSWELAAEFSCGKMQINNILALKSFLLERWTSNKGGYI